MKAAHAQAAPQGQSARESAANLAALAKAAADNADADDDGQGGANTCFICAEPVQYWALGSCNHRTCHTCSIRLRALYKKRECTFCKASPCLPVTLSSSTREALLTAFENMTCRRNAIQSFSPNLIARRSKSTTPKRHLSATPR